MPDCSVQLPWVRHRSEYTVLGLSGGQVLIGLSLQRSEQCGECRRLQLTLFEHQSPSGPAAYWSQHTAHSTLLSAHCPQHTIGACWWLQHTALSTLQQALVAAHTGRTTRGCIRWLTWHPNPNGWSSPGTAQQPLWSERIFESSFNRRELQSELSCVVALQHHSVTVQHHNITVQHHSTTVGLLTALLCVSYIYKDVIAMRTQLHYRVNPNPNPVNERAKKAINRVRFLH